MLLSHSRDQGLYPPPDSSLSSCCRQGNSAPAPLRLSPFPCTANSGRLGTTSPFQTDAPKDTFAALAFLCRPVSAARHSFFWHMSRIQRMIARADSAIRRDLLYRLCHNPEHPYRHTVRFRTKADLFPLCIGALVPVRPAVFPVFVNEAFPTFPGIPQRMPHWTSHTPFLIPKKTTHHSFCLHLY